MIDFTKAFDRVDHSTQFAKLNKLDLLPHAINWKISYLSGYLFEINNYFIMQFEHGRIQRGPNRRPLNSAKIS